MTAPTKLVVFDWNGTLFDDFDAMLKCNNIVFTRFGGKEATPDFYRENYAIPFSSMLRNHGFDDGEIAVIDEQSKQIFHDHYEQHAEKLGLRTGADEILQHIETNGGQSLILSNHLVEPIRVQLKRLKIEHLFADVLAYANRETQFLHMTKGEKLKKYMKEKNLQPRHALIVGDSTEEISIAREQGLVSVAITGGCVSEARLREAKPDHVIHTLHALKPILNERGFFA